MSRPPIFWKVLIAWLVLGAPALILGFLMVGPNFDQFGEKLGDQIIATIEALTWLASILWTIGTPILLIAMEFKFRQRRSAARESF